MSDESKVARPGQQDEAPDEVEGHAKIARPGATDEARIGRPGEIDEGDDVEAHGKFDSPKSDSKMV